MSVVATMVPFLVVGASPAQAVGLVPAAPVNVQAAAVPYSVAVSWSPPASDGGSPITGYKVTLAPGNQTVTVAASERSASLNGLPGNIAVAASVVAINANGIGAAAAAPPVTPLDAGGTFNPLTPARILDTRTGNGGFSTPIGTQASIDVSILGQGGVPATGVSTVIVNITLTEGTTGTFLTAWPTGQPRPTTSNLNVAAGETDPNLVEVAVGANGKVSLYNNSGSVHAIMDVLGWIASDGSLGAGSGLFRPIEPRRILDTRIGNGGTTIAAGGVLDLQVAGRGGVPAAGVSAVAINITAIEPTTGTFLTAWPTGQPRPTASTANVGPYQIVPNRAVVKLGAGGMISLYNALGLVNVVVDVNGWFTDASDPRVVGAYAKAQTPVRILDTRDPNNGGVAKIVSGTPKRVPVAGVGGVPSMSTSMPPTAVVANVTVVDSSSGSFLTVWPGGAAKPGTSDLNFPPGTPIPNLVIAKLGPDGSINIATELGDVHVIVDVMGWFLGDAVIAPNVEVLTQTVASYITAMTATSVTFSSLPASVAVGDILVAPATTQTPTGLLRRVVAIGSGPTGIVVTTTDASIGEAIPQGNINYAGTPGAPTGPGAIPATAAATGSWGANFPFDHTFSGSGGTARLSGDLALSATANFNFSWKCCFNNISVRTEVQAGEIFNANLHATYNGVLDETFALPPITMGQISFAIGPVPIVLVPRLNASLRVTGEAHATLDATVSQSESVNAGFAWDQGNAPTAWATRNSAAPTVTGPTFNGAIALRGELVPEVELRLYDQQQASAAVQAIVWAQANGTWNPPNCSASLVFGVDKGYRFTFLNLTGSDRSPVITPLVFAGATNCVQPGPDGPWSGLVRYTRHTEFAQTAASAGQVGDLTVNVNVGGPGGLNIAGTWYQPFSYVASYGALGTDRNCYTYSDTGYSAGTRSGVDGMKFDYYLTHFLTQWRTNNWATRRTGDNCGTPIDITYPADQFASRAMPSLDLSNTSVSIERTTSGAFPPSLATVDTYTLSYRFTRLPDADMDGIPDAVDPQPNVSNPLP